MQVASRPARLLVEAGLHYGSWTCSCLPQSQCSVSCLQVRRQDSEQWRPGAGDAAAGRVVGRAAHPQHGEERHGLHAAARPQASSGPGIESLFLPVLLSLLTPPSPSQAK